MNHVELHKTTDSGTYLTVSQDLCDAVKRWLRENGIPYVIDKNSASKKQESVFEVICVPRYVCQEDLEEFFDWRDRHYEDNDLVKVDSNTAKQPKSM